MSTVTPLPNIVLEPLVKMALAEDLGRMGDITSAATIPAEARAKVVMNAREEGRICGLDLAELAFKAIDPVLAVKRLLPEGADVKKGDAVMEVEGHGQSQNQNRRHPQNDAGAAQRGKIRGAGRRRHSPPLRAG
jgi:nicotinate-nucleotide pyrophosphorylase (carboxylating)